MKYSVISKQQKRLWQSKDEIRNGEGEKGGMGGK
jgi:hypothetical protein